MTFILATTPATNGTDSGQFIGVPIGDSARVLVLVLGWLAWVSGVFGNILIIVTLLSQPTLRCHIYNIYIGNLAVSDLIAVGYCLPFWMLDLILGYHPVVNIQHCQANAYINCWCVLASIYTLLTIALNRYLSVCRPSLYARVFTRTNTILLCFVIWALSGAVTVTPFFHVDNSAYLYIPLSHMCAFDGTRPASLANIISILSLIVPSILVGVFSFAIYRYWRLNRKRVGQWATALSRPQATSSTADHVGEGGVVVREGRVTVPANRLSSSNMALIRSLVLVVCLLVVLYLPLAVALSVGYIVSGDVSVTFVMLLFINHSINWIVYGVMNRKFRDGYRRLFVNRCFCVRPAAETTETT